MKLRIAVNGQTFDVDVEVVGEGETSRPPSAVAAPVAAAAAVPPPAAPMAAPLPPPSAPTTPISDRLVKAPLAGTILEVKVSAGDAISLNQVLLTMEAMKMETLVASPIVGRVAAVHVKAGEVVRAGQLLFEFE